MPQFRQSRSINETIIHRIDYSKGNNKLYCRSAIIRPLSSTMFQPNDSGSMRDSTSTLRTPYTSIFLTEAMPSSSSSTLVLLTVRIQEETFPIPVVVLVLTATDVPPPRRERSFSSLLIALALQTNGRDPVCRNLPSSLSTSSSQEHQLDPIHHVESHASAAAEQKTKGFDEPAERDDFDQETIGRCSYLSRRLRATKPGPLLDASQYARN